MPHKILTQPDPADTTDGGKEEEDGKRGGGKLLDKFRKLKNSKKTEEIQGTEALYTILDIFRNRHLTINLLCMSFCL